MGREPGAGVMRKLEGRAEAVAGTFSAQNVASTLWAYATLGREPGADLMRVLEGRGMGGERSSSMRTWAVEFDGPSHLLTSTAPTGATLLKRRHLS